MSSNINMHEVGLVVKLSSSNILKSAAFYTENLGFVVDKRYTINSNGNYGPNSYMQLTLPGLDTTIAIGLFKDIDEPLPAQATGTAPTFVVADLASVRTKLLANGVTVGEIIKNTSDEGYIDIFAFFADPDNNTLVIRENVN
jgi:catechol 2,3-dioxygenase-like lactoylglutathione lyase family enzyme